MRPNDDPNGSVRPEDLRRQAKQTIERLTRRFDPKTDTVAWNEAVAVLYPEATSDIRA